eukprot:Lankesteria_metandrocarpae@DN8602_c0_g1_i1.p1
MPTEAGGSRVQSASVKSTSSYDSPVSDSGTRRGWDEIQSYDNRSSVCGAGGITPVDTNNEEKYDHEQQQQHSVEDTPQSIGSSTTNKASSSLYFQDILKWPVPTHLTTVIITNSAFASSSSGTSRTRPAVIKRRRPNSELARCAEWLGVGLGYVEYATPSTRHHLSIYGSFYEYIQRTQGQKKNQNECNANNINESMDCINSDLAGRSDEVTSGSFAHRPSQTENSGSDTRLFTYKDRRSSSSSWQNLSQQKHSIPPCSDAVHT